jgi:spore germination protein YaaH
LRQPQSRSSRRLRGALSIAFGLLLAAPLGVDAAGPGRGIARADGPEATSPQYRQAQEHAGDVIDFEGGARVTEAFVPRDNDDWDVDGAQARPTPAGLASGLQLRAAPANRVWAAGVPEDVAAPWHFLGMRGASEPTSASEPGPAVGTTLASVTVPQTRTEAPGGARVSPSGLRREVFGFLPYWQLADRSTVLDWRTLSTVAYFSVGCNANGTLARHNPDGSMTTGWAGWTSSRMTSIINAAHQHQTRVVLTVSCFAWSTLGATAQTALLGSAIARATLARQIAAAVRDRGADGVNLDFEPIAAGYGDAFTRLVRAVRSELNAVARGYQLTFDAMASVGNQPIAQATAPGGADAVLIMGYDYRTEGADVAGSIAPLRGPAYDLTDTVRAFTALTSPSKVILGVPWYGRAWSTPTNDLHAKNISGARYGRVAEPTYAQAYPLLAAYGRRWDPIELTAWTAYHRETCTAAYGCVTSWRELYIDDAASLRLRYDLVNRASLRGAGIWALGYDADHPELRAALASKFLGDRTPPVAGIVTLSPRQRDEGFRVAWTSYDDSAIRSYDVQVSVNGGAWRSWRSGTTATSAVYLGSTDHRYAFRVRATDVHGNVSAWRPVPLSLLGVPGRIAVGGFATVVIAGLRLRAAPSTSAAIMTTFRVGDALRIIGGPARANGYTWYEVAGPVHEWPRVGPMQVGGWVAVAGNGYVNAVPRNPVYSTLVDAGIASLQLNGGGARVLTPNGDGSNDQLPLTWVNDLQLDTLTLRVFRADGRLAGEERLWGTRLARGRHALAWDGRIDGARVASGTYILQLQGTAGGRTYSAPSASPVSPTQLARWSVVVE